MMEEQQDTMKTCPRCFEHVNAQAQICRYCLSQIGEPKDGQTVRVRIRAAGKVYRGDLFVGKTERMSDAINDGRRFIIMTRVKEEGKLRDVAMDFLAINKDSIESVALCEKDEM